MEQSEISRIGRILKERRLQLGYTQEYAAEKAGISYSYYTKIERGQQLPSLEVAMVLSKTFSLSMDRWLLSQAHDYRMSPAALNLIQYVSSLDNKTIETIQELLSKASFFVFPGVCRNRSREFAMYSLQNRRGLGPAVSSVSLPGRLWRAAPGSFRWFCYPGSRHSG